MQKKGENLTKFQSSFESLLLLTYKESFQPPDTEHILNLCFDSERRSKKWFLYPVEYLPIPSNAAEESQPEVKIWVQFRASPSEKVPLPNAIRIFGVPWSTTKLGF